jgi:hypothetical protein
MALVYGGLGTMIPSFVAQIFGVKKSRYSIRKSRGAPDHSASRLTPSKADVGGIVTDSAAKPSRPTMWCRKCGYPLDGLSENRCPECSQGFDLTDDNSVSRKAPPGQCPVCSKTPDKSMRGWGKTKPIECRHCGAMLTRHPLALKWIVVSVLLMGTPFISGAWFFLYLVMPHLIEDLESRVFIALVAFVTVAIQGLLLVTPGFLLTLFLGRKYSQFSNRQEPD